MASVRGVIFTNYGGGLDEEEGGAGWKTKLIPFTHVWETHRRGHQEIEGYRT